MTELVQSIKMAEIQKAEENKNNLNNVNNNTYFIITEDEFTF